MTMVKFDSFLTDVRAGRILTDFEFELLSYDKEGSVVSVRYNGVYVIVDNGYLAWSPRLVIFLLELKSSKDPHS